MLVNAIASNFFLFEILFLSSVFASLYWRVNRNKEIPSMLLVGTVLVVQFLCLFYVRLSIKNYDGYDGILTIIESVGAFLVTIFIIGVSAGLASRKKALKLQETKTEVFDKVIPKKIISHKIAYLIMVLCLGIIICVWNL